ncbi:MAG: CPBP family intramembrane metalloprotease [Verrucomicrobiae bacterium]|nr:CPBP family intramembrane metalloprotease [Verrucomicrobiae bacterium]
MRPLASFILFLAGCLIFAALAAPAVFLGVHWLADRTSWEIADYCARHPFSRYFNRCLQAAMLLSIWPLLRATGFASARALALRGPNAARDLLLGAATSVGTLALYISLLLAFGGARLRDTPPFERLGGILTAALLSAALVALFEEIFFRGYAYQLFRREGGRALAYAVQLTLFPLVHFLKPPRPPSEMAVDALSGFRMIGASFGGLERADAVAGGFIVLVAVAWMLCRALERRGTLWLAIGMHAGWILPQLIASEFLQPGAAVAQWPNWILGGGNLAHGALVLLPLAVQARILGLFGTHARSGAA